ncbi:cutinase family protein [Nocardioides sp. MAH-18]|uniref:Cutinase family protein n=1 Tax=Nocardioides agri TaxID=2682843 RepID=A0A6L6XVY0_9ACTN|nr:cutinase family protein [Nocardioides sp. CGMCC 1.13656]MBA2956375.1 cutinase family protein [Nocardioides sp. CGMCC 1.13656]MVQ51218.1 cutinase family protein [Nocardioides sp. MAH-18]
MTLGTRHHLRKAGAASLLVLALTASLLAATSSSVEAGDEVGATSPTARRSSCADVLLVGVDGNGQGPKRGKTFGPAVGRFAGTYARQLGRGRSVQEKRLAVRTPKLATLTARHLSGKPAADSIRKASLRRWLAPVPQARKAVIATLDAAATSCPEQQFVLVGYAQGARAVHGALGTLRERPYGGRIVAGVLISDPGHRKGIEVRLGRKVDAPPAPSDTFGVWNICTTGDLVCAPGRTAFRPAVATAQRYHRSTPTVTKVRAAVLDRARRWPAPKPAITVRAALVDAPIQIALQADATASTRPGAQWTATSALPPGVTLSPTGVLSGAVSTRGQWAITYTVAGTAPATTPHSGQVVLTVSDGATSVSSGGQVTCATDGGGGATCWGANQFGQLGNGTTAGSAAPVAVAGTGWQSISTSGGSTCGIKVDGTLWCWGLNNFAQLGIDKTAPQKKPRQVSPGTAWSKVSTSWFNTCAITTGGDLYCWGQNLRGAVGTGGTSRLVARPVLVGPAGAGWLDVSTGGWHTCAVRGDGTMWCWGQNTFGQVGNATAGVQTAPVQVGPATNWRQVSTSWGHSCGVTGAGEMACWGINKDGQIGTGTLDDAWSPQPVGAGQVWTSVSAGDASTCALNSGAQTWCWGGNRYGQLGTGTNVGSAVPVLASALPALTSLTSGWMHACGLAGPVPMCWGSNEAGQLGASGTPPTARSAAVSSADAARAHDVVRRGAVALRLSPAAQVESEIGDRPAVSATARRKAKKSFTAKVMTFNLLGSQHTAPTGDRPDWAPGRIRSEWASSLITSRDGSLVGLQEIQPDQVTSLNAATEGRYTFFPGTSMGYAGAPQSIMWRTADWTPVWTDTVTIPFMRNQPRPQPVVRLRNNASGQELYFINAHFSPGSMESDRRRATAIIIRTIRKLQKDGLPILLTGDLNDNHRVFCQVTGKTKLRAALGGSNNGSCKPPAGRRVDWIFGSVGAFGQIAISQGSQVRRTTDHSVHDVPFSVQ